MQVNSVTVAVPVLNGGERFLLLLEAVAAQRNDAKVDLEILIVDSGSTDGSVEAARKAGARVIEIDKSEFQHGRTRNFAVREAKGEVVALLTDDSVPASDIWLDSIVEAFAQADDVALVWGPQHALPEHPHFVRREHGDHFNMWGKDGQMELQRIGTGAEGLEEYEANQGYFVYFSDANGAVAKWAWEDHPYREVPYAEDQLISREMLEAGLAKVFHAGAAVDHSHHFGVIGSFQRSFDDYRGLLEVLGFRSSIGVRSGARAALGLTRSDRAMLRFEGASGRDLFFGTLTSLRHHTLRIIAEWSAARADRMPHWLSRTLSKEGRAGVNPLSQ
ncbi:MAG: glycosyltransferase family A protein [Solirubrobacterales bacterium]